MSSGCLLGPGEIPSHSHSHAAEAALPRAPWWDQADLVAGGPQVAGNAMLSARPQPREAPDRTSCRPHREPWPPRPVLSTAHWQIESGVGRPGCGSDSDVGGSGEEPVPCMTVGPPQGPPAVPFQHLTMKCSRDKQKMRSAAEGLACFSLSSLKWMF